MKSIFAVEILLATSGFIITNAIIGLVIDRFVRRRLDKLARLTQWESDENFIASFQWLT